MVTNMTKAIQQIMLGTVTKNEKQDQSGRI